MPLADVAAILADEPFCLTIEQIKRVTPYQLRNVYFRERDEQGRIKLADRGKKVDYQSQFWLWGRKLAYPDWMIQKLWKQRLQKLAEQSEKRT